MESGKNLEFTRVLETVKGRQGNVAQYSRVFQSKYLFDLLASVALKLFCPAGVAVCGAC